eukprot:1144235-Pelagomonas_calceolata.AAC.4
MHERWQANSPVLPHILLRDSITNCRLGGSITASLFLKQDVTHLRTQFQHLFTSAPPSHASCLRDFTN